MPGVYSIKLKLVALFSSALAQAFEIMALVILTEVALH